MNVRGIVLAGGQSSRFGEDKALARVRGMTLLERAIHHLRELDLKPAVITNASRNYPFLDCPVYCDLIPGKGPLGGLYTAFQIFKGSSLLVLTCDMPSVSTLVSQVLLNEHQKENQMTVFGFGPDRLQPFPGIYQSSLSEVIFEALERNELSVQSFLERIPEKKVISAQWDTGIFFNVNKKEDLQDWMARHASCENS